MIKNDILLYFALKTSNLINILDKLNKNYNNYLYININNFYLNPSRTLLLSDYKSNNKIKGLLIHTYKLPYNTTVKLLKFNNTKLIQLLKFKTQK